MLTYAQDDLDHVSDAETIRIAESGSNFYTKKLPHEQMLGEQIFLIAFRDCRFAESVDILDNVDFSFLFVFGCEGLACPVFCDTS